MVMLSQLAELPSESPRALLVTGMSGAGRTSALKILEDLGYEAVDNLPLSLFDKLLATDDAAEIADVADAIERPLAIGIDSRTRAFDADAIAARIGDLRAEGVEITLVFLDCSGTELTRRFSETRRRHPLALDRPAADGIAREREIVAPLRRIADIVIDTSDYAVRDLRRALAGRFSRAAVEPLTLTILSFGFARGLPRDADLVFDMRFLANPHWDVILRPMTGEDDAVGAYIAADPAFAPAFDRIFDLLLLLLPRYGAEGKAYLTVAFGCTGGRHRSVYVARMMADRLAAAGWGGSVVHRDKSAAGSDAAEERRTRGGAGFDADPALPALD
jgi:RNase adaptor protein for sRNA GlmZ degradation